VIAPGPLKGSPEGLEALAEALSASAARVGDHAHAARSLGRGVTWESPAGAEFATQLAQLAPVLQAVADRYAGAAPELRRLAEALRRAQTAIAAAIEEWHRGDDGIVSTQQRLDAAAMSGVDPNAPQVVAVREEQRGYVARRQQADAAHTRAWMDYVAADQHCAAALDALALDTIGDPAAYRLLHGIEAVADGISLVGSIPGAGWAAKRFPAVGLPILLAGWASVASRGALLVFYDEGSWRDLGLDALSTAMSFTGGSLVKGAVAGTAKGVNGEVRCVKEYTAAQRARLGLRAEASERWAKARSRFSFKRSSNPPVAEPVTGTLAQRAQQLASRAKESARATADRLLLDDLRAAGAAGTEGMYAAGVTVREAPKVIDAVTSRAEAPDEPRSQRKVVATH